jgi:hypothetical protein
MPNAVLVKFTKHGSALAVKDLNAAAVVDKEYNSKHAGKFMKKLMDDSSKFKAVHSKLNEAYLWHRNVTMPFLDNGMRMLNVEKLDEYMQKMAAYKSDIQRLLLDLKPEWDNEVNLDMQRLGGLANPKDYPDFTEVEYRYKIDVKVLPVPEAQDFRFQVDQEIVNELDRMKNQAKIEGRKEVYERVERVVSAAASNCSKDKPRIHETLLGNMADLADIMKYLNIHEDPEMNVVAEKLAELANSCSTFNLRNDEVVRKQLAKDCDTFISKLRNGNWFEIEEPEEQDRESYTDDQDRESYQVSELQNSVV